MRKIFKPIVIFLLIAFLLTLSACDESKNPNTKKADPNNVYPRTVNDKEAQALARTLYHNNELANATFSFKSGSIGSGGFTGQGIVDWKNLNVAIRVSLQNVNQIDIGSIATVDGVFESVLDLNQSLTVAGYGSFDWVKRSFDPTQYGIDSISQFILKLGATAPDNPLLIKQNGATILGVENVNGVKTFKMQNNGSVTYYVSEKDVLMRVEADIKGFSGTVVVDFDEQGNSVVDVPEESAAISIDKISELYTKLRPQF